MGFSMISIFLGSSGFGMVYLLARHVALDDVLDSLASKTLALVLLPEIHDGEDRDEEVHLDTVGDEVTDQLDLNRVQAGVVDQRDLLGEVDDLGDVLVELVDDQRGHLANERDQHHPEDEAKDDG